MTNFPWKRSVERYFTNVLTARVIVLVAITIQTSTSVSGSGTDYSMATRCHNYRTTLNLTDSQYMNLYLKRSGMTLENPLTCTIRVVSTTQASMYVRFLGNYRIGVTGFIGISIRQRNKEGINIYHETTEGIEYVVGRATATWFGVKGKSILGRSVHEQYPRSMGRLTTMKIGSPFFIYYTGNPREDNFQIQISHNDFDQCDDNIIMSPCLNGGTCIDGHMNYTCICKIGYQGDRCDEKVRPSCSIGTPCNNHNQKCIQLNNTHHRCDCIEGYVCANQIHV
ncbi:unnamed protein product [Owenia fusiformis]|uniref:EGF-like domain-containing protein n=1 Tax=Owenia fusiformis TaxID=6347 RepID=A0A8S4Q5R8_OWEFU|nr:unnamed protein product [Owenia fusiformis]